MFSYKQESATGKEAKNTGTIVNNKIEKSPLAQVIEKNEIKTSPEKAKDLQGTPAPVAKKTEVDVQQTPPPVAPPRKKRQQKKEALAKSQVCLRYSELFS